MIQQIGGLPVFIFVCLVYIPINLIEEMVIKFNIKLLVIFLVLLVIICVILKK